MNAPVLLEIHMKVVLVAINAKFVHSNLALYSLYQSAKDYRKHLEIAEYTINHEMDSIVRDLYQKNADVICFSCYIWNIEYVRDAAREIKKVRPDVHIWFGGPEVSYDGPGIFDANPYLDGIMIGEGERTFTELMAYYCNASNTALDDIAGIMFRKNNKVIQTPCRFLEDLDDLPFVYADMEQFEHKIIYYESSRGCPFQCSYCMSSIDKTVRFRSLTQVFSHLQFFLDHQVAQVKFIDRTFNIRKDRTVAILQYLSEHDNGVTNFHFEIASDLISEEEIELFAKLRPGYVQLEIGVQSTNVPTIREIRRNMDFCKVAGIVRQLKEPNNIHIHLDLIAGLPEEDIHSFIQSFNDVYRLKPHELQLGFLKVLKGSYMHEKAGEYGIVYGDKAPYEVMKTNWLTFDDIIRLKNVEEMLEVYYNSGLFPNTMEYLEHFFESAFAMYDELSTFYEANGYFGLKHTRMTRYQILFDFMKQKVQQYSAVEEKFAAQLLLLDLYLREDLKTRPSFALSVEDYKEKIKDVRQTIAPEWKGKMFHIEPFSIDVLQWLQKKNLVEAENVVLFDYEHKHPVSKMAAVYQLSGEM